MNLANVLLPAAALLGTGGLIGLILGFAAKIMAVDVNPLVETLTEVLPGVNCGACGYSGCAAYAEALASRSETKMNLCTPGGNNVASEIGVLLGVAVVEHLEPMTAVVKCSGTCEKVEKIADYRGVPSCRECNKFFGGNSACYYGCLGFGDCAEGCPFNAIYMYNGVPIVDKSMCVSCGLCVATCPHGLIILEKSSHDIKVLCASFDSGKVVRSICSAGCIACKRCEKECNFDAIEIKGNLAYIDPDKCTNCGDCIAVCPTQVIRKASLAVQVH